MTDFNEAMQTSQMWQNQWNEQRDTSNLQGQIDTLDARTRFIENTLLALTGIDLTQPDALPLAMKAAHEQFAVDLTPKPVAASSGGEVSGAQVAIVFGAVVIIAVAVIVLHLIGCC